MTEVTSPEPETLAKTFEPAAIEKRWYQHWETNGLFRPERPDAAPFTIVNPPPNVTGSLHIGHALDNTLQDVAVRYERLRGKDALWVVGTDHAGIATQMVVERQLEAAQDKRTNYTREQFVDKVWQWKAESGGAITGQLRRLGCSMDWSREQFTMDPHFTRAVTKVFVDLYNRGLIYRDKRLVNWDPKLKTAISDLEVETREVKGHMWHFKYPLAGGETYTYIERDAEGNVVLEEERDYIAIATTRPETMLGDGAVAVHPDDARYAPIVGKLCEIPVGPKAHRRLIPIITDEYPDPDFGSGAVKITGAHDENDFAVAQRAGIPMYRLMDETATMRRDGAPYAAASERAKAIAAGEQASAAEIDTLNLVPEAYRGLDRYEARKRVVADIDADGLMIKVEDKVIMQPFGDRGGVVIEPMLTDQWYVNAAELAKSPIAAVRSGAVEIVPKTWEKTFFNWMENIQPWCVSRQLWWGHRIPAWYGPTKDDLSLWGTAHPLAIGPGLVAANPPLRVGSGHIVVAETEDAAKEQFAHYYGKQPHEIELADRTQTGMPKEAKGVTVWRDEDVLDTWFSSALWPFATLGWPETGNAPNPAHAELVEAPSFPSDDAQTSESKNSPSTSSGWAVFGGADGSLLAKHYPNDLLISGFDILFFWDARMMMMGQAMTGQNPWKRLYLHGLVRAADGQKMSKSKGNVVDPLLLIDKYGADALRFFMCAMESQGRDVKMDERRVEGYRNFATKLWNAARFCMANGITGSTSLAAPKATSAVNRWIIGEVVETLAALDAAMADLRFDAAANAIYHFVWDQFCDWYIELTKPLLAPLPFRGGAGGGGSPASAAVADSPHPNPSLEGEGLASETRAVAGWVLDQILVMLHPFMPFVTEELWHALGTRSAELIVAEWPAPQANVDPAAKAEVEWLIGLIKNIRAARSELNVPPSARPQMVVFHQSKPVEQFVYNNEAAILRMARVGMVFPNQNREDDPTWDKVQTITAKRGAILIETEGFGANINLEGVIDIAAEKARLEKALASSEKEAKSLEGRLNNPAFAEKAKPEAVEKARADHAHHRAEATRLAAALARLG